MYHTTVPTHAALSRRAMATEQRGAVSQQHGGIDGNEAVRQSDSQPVSLFGSRCDRIARIERRQRPPRRGTPLAKSRVAVSVIVHAHTVYYSNIYSTFSIIASPSSTSNGTGGEASSTNEQHIMVMAMNNLQCLLPVLYFSINNVQPCASTQ